MNNCSRKNNPPWSCNQDIETLKMISADFNINFFIGSLIQWVQKENNCLEADRCLVQVEYGFPSFTYLDRDLTGTAWKVK